MSPGQRHRDGAPGDRLRWLTEAPPIFSLDESHCAASADNIIVRLNAS
jgi:hypothetical protein